MELETPNLLQDGHIQPLAEIIGPGMPRVGVGMADIPFGADSVELAANLFASIRQHRLDLPTGVVEGR